jgi:hypothetical protein
VAAGLLGMKTRILLTQSSSQQNNSMVTQSRQGSTSGNKLGHIASSSLRVYGRCTKHNAQYGTIKWSTRQSAACPVCECEQEIQLQSKALIYVTKVLDDTRRPPHFHTAIRALSHRSFLQLYHNENCSSYQSSSSSWAHKRGSIAGRNAFCFPWAFELP